MPCCGLPMAFSSPQGKRNATELLNASLLLERAIFACFAMHLQWAPHMTQVPWQTLTSNIPAYCLHRRGLSSASLPAKLDGLSDTTSTFQPNLQSVPQEVMEPVKPLRLPRAAKENSTTRGAYNTASIVPKPKTDTSVSPQTALMANA